MNGSLARLLVLLAAGLPIACSGATGAGDPCAGVDCSSHGVCIAVADSRYCWCAAGWIPVGDACIQPDGGEPCDYIDCEGHGTCWMSGGEARCRCETGWEELVPGHCIQPPADGGPPDDATGDGDANDGAADDDIAAEVDAPGCGDGTISGAEQCDDGNAVPGDGCESNCTFTCSSAADCDDANTCTTDACAPGGTGRLCSHTPTPGAGCDDGDACTNGEQCDTSGACTGGTSVCACATNADCAPYEDGNLCNGTLVCTPSRLCELNPTTIVTCDPGLDTACRQNVCQPATGTCSMSDRPDGTACDDGQFCTASSSCRLGTCTGSGSPCSRSCETCDEGGDRCVAAGGWCILDGACVADGTVHPSNGCLGCSSAANPYGWSGRTGAPCDNGAWCDGPDACDAAGSCAPAGAPPCPTGACNGCNDGTDTCGPAPAGTVCRPAVDVCDREETCSGTATTCPADRLQNTLYECRAPVGPCDRSETCTGLSTTCPTDTFLGAAYSCRVPAGLCDVRERCDGTGPDCPPDLLHEVGYRCRAAMDSICDFPETCDGTSVDCPANVIAPAGTPCEADPCTDPDVCDGFGSCMAGAYICG